MVFYRMRIILLLFFIILLTACNSDQHFTQTTSSITSTLSKTFSTIPTATSITSTIEPTKTIANESPTTIYKTQMPTIGTTLSLTQEPTLTTNTECPQKIPADSGSILTNGSILFTFDGPLSPGGVWTFSSGNSAPQKITEGLEVTHPNFVLLSPDKSQLAWLDVLNEPRVLIIYNPLTDKKTYIPAENDWSITEEWQADGRIKILTNTIETQTIGLKYSYNLFNPFLYNSTELTEDFKLPELQLDQNRWWAGYASINPSRNKVFYTALDGNHTDFVLRDTDNNKEIWRDKTNSYQSYIPIAS
jgi:hypothetical protein